MTDQFQHVMVLTSIIIGLGITHLLLGVSSAIDCISLRRPVRLSWAVGFWLALLFEWMIQFWWWEFRLSEILKNWSQWNYLLVISYAVILFLLVAILVPRKWDEVSDLNDHFLAKRSWFYSLLLLAFAVDVMDSYMKGGWDYIRTSGIVSWGQSIAAVPACALGIRSDNIRIHTTMGAVFFVWTVIIGFDIFPLLRL